MLRKALTVTMLFGAMVMLDLLHNPDTNAFNAEAMAVFGFIVLAAYMLGELAEVVKLPHITGYLLTGVICGPFFIGILSEEVVKELKLFDHLAIALIALSAGAALSLGALKKGFKLILSILTSQFFFLVVMIGAVVLLSSGIIPGFSLPFLVDTPWGFRIATALCIGLIGAAMSPAATIAIVHESHAKGPVTDAVMGISVLNNVVVVVLFTLALAISQILAPEFMHASSHGSVIGELATKIGGAAVLGVVLGASISLYIRYLAAELLLIVVGLAFTVTWVATSVGIDPVLAFITAGFTARNLFPNEEIALSRIISKLSMPIYVVFFFLAGAGLHIDAVLQMWVFALLFFVTRLGALWVGTRVGTRLADGPKIIADHGWLGFGAQAGIALSMAKALEHAFGDTGLALETLAVAGIALNELVGPVLLKVCLGLAGETNSEQALPQMSDETQITNQIELTEEGVATKLPEWQPEPHSERKDPFADKPPFSDRELITISRAVKADLSSLVSDLRSGIITNNRDASRLFIGQLRREFLRTHRRCSVSASNPDCKSKDFKFELEQHQSDLSLRWQDLILDKTASTNFKDVRNSFEMILNRIDDLIASFPDRVVVPMEAALWTPQEDDTFKISLKKRLIRARRTLGADVQRTVEVGKVGRYIFDQAIGEHLEQVIGLMAMVDRHAVDKAQSLFEIYRQSIERHLPKEETSCEERAERLQNIRDEMEEEFDSALEEADRLSDETVRVANTALGRPYKELLRLLNITGSPMDPNRRYRASKVYDSRVRSVGRIENGLTHALAITRSTGSALAMELELTRLTIRVKEVLSRRASEFARDLNGRIARQGERVIEALDTMLSTVRSELETTNEVDTDLLSTTVRDLSDNLSKTVTETQGISESFLNALKTETAFDPLRSELTSCIDLSKDYFTVNEGGTDRTGRALPQKHKTRDVPFRKLVSQYVETELRRDLSGLLSEVLKEVTELYQSVEELERGLAYNTEVTLSELEEKSEAPADTIKKSVEELLITSLNRHSKRLGAEQSDTAQLAASVEERIIGTVVNHLHELRGLLIEGRYQEMMDRLARARAHERRVEMTGKALGALHLRTHGSAALHKLLGIRGTATLKRALGLRDTEQTLALTPATFQMPVLSFDFPVVYFRLFSDPNLEARDLLVGREDEVEALKRTLLGDNSGSSRAVAVLGEGANGYGAAVSGVIRGLSRQLTIRRHKLSGPASIEDVHEILSVANKRCLTIVENMHWLYTLEHGGFEPLRILLDGVLNDRGNNAWILAGETSAWEYASHHVPLKDVFPQQLDVHKLTVSELRQALLNRHNMSGYGLRFADAHTSTLWMIKRHIFKGLQEVEPNEAKFFEAIHREAGGVLRDAQSLWLASASVLDDEREELIMGAAATTPLSACRKLPEEMLLTLRQVARQGRITANQHAMVFQSSETSSEALLNRLAHLGFLKRHPSGWYRFTRNRAGLIYRTLRDKGYTR
jgi:Kef-type K+ transport system membrane component KefB